MNENLKVHYQNLLLYLGQLELKINQTKQVLNDLKKSYSDTVNELNVLEDLLNEFNLENNDDSITSNESIDNNTS